MKDTKDIFRELAKLDRRLVKSKKVEWKDKKTGETKSYTAQYVTARTVMNILDGVVGPANWRTEFEPFANGVVQCTLYLRIDEEWLGKSDVGTKTDIEPEKGAVSDALKRAAVHWGIARELYREGTADLDDDPPQPEPVHDRTRDTTADEPGDVSELDAITWTRDTTACNKFIDWAQKEWSTPGAEPLEFPHLINRIIKALSLEGKAKNRAELRALLETYTGTKEDAAAAVRNYQSEDKS